MDLASPTASNLIALLLGVIGVGIAATPIITSWRRSRRAQLVCRFEYLLIDGFRDLERIVIENLGPAAVEELSVAWVRRQYSSEELPGDVVAAIQSWDLPIAVLQPGQEYHLPWSSSIDEPDPGRIKLTWRDPANTGPREFALSGIRLL